MNDLWWSQVEDIHEELGKGSVHFKQAELELFYRCYKRMKDDNLSQTAIREHFKHAFNIGYSAFYTRLRKVGKLHVL